MYNKIIALILIVFMAAGAVTAQAESTPVLQKNQTAPANMSDAALASYISGKLAPLLKDTGYAVSQDCDASGCSVVVQP
jgi:hypothetical protein